MDHYTPDTTSPALLAALRFMWQHREEGMTYHIEDETVLRVRPSEKAHEHAGAIKELEPYLMRLASRRQWTPEMASTLVSQAHTRNAGLLRGKLVEVIEHIQADRPELWAEVQQAYQDIDRAYAAREWKAFSRALCRHMDLYDEMLLDYSAAEAA